MNDLPGKPVETPKARIRFAEGDLAVLERLSDFKRVEAPENA